jgi:hypothetical protein
MQKMHSHAETTDFCVASAQEDAIRRDFADASADVRIVNDDPTCAAWIEGPWHSIIASEPSAVLQFAVAFAYALKAAGVSEEEHSRIVRIYFLTIAHIFMLDKNRCPVVAATGVDINAALGDALREVGASSDAVNQYMSYLSMWRRTREWEDEVLSQRLRVPDCLWFEWRSLNIGISSIANLAMSVLRERRAREHVCGTDCLLASVEMTHLAGTMVAYINDVASYRKDAASGDELNFFINAGIRVEDSDVCPTIVRLVEEYNRRLPAVFSPDVGPCEATRMWCIVLAAIFRGNAAVSLCSRRYTATVGEFEDY